MSSKYLRASRMELPGCPLERMVMSKQQVLRWEEEYLLEPLLLTRPHPESHGCNSCAPYGNLVGC